MNWHVTAAATYCNAPNEMLVKASDEKTAHRIHLSFAFFKGNPNIDLSTTSNAPISKEKQEKH